MLHMSNDRLIEVDEFLDLRAAGDKTIVLDVRGQDEWSEGRIPGAHLLQYWLIPFKIADIAPDKQVNIVVYCQTGGRSTVAAQMLESLGYVHVRNLLGGFEAYKTGGGEVEGEE